MLKIIPLGGLGEIGLNMMVFEFKDSLFIIDAGLMFPEEYMLGIDYVIPEIEYLRKNKGKISGIVLTHAHEDHIGALPYLLKEIEMPVFGTSFTLEVVKNKLEDQGLPLTHLLHEISVQETLRLGIFTVEFISVNHSVVDGVGLAIKTPLGLIVHTGDFKINRTPADGLITDTDKFAYYGKKGVLALMSDSTNVEKEGYTISDQEIGKTFTKIIADSPGRIIIALFASNIPRVQQIVDIAIRLGRKIVFNGRNIETNVKIARRLGYLRMPEKEEVFIDQIDSLPDHKLLIITTGSQGEPMAALARMAAGTHKQIRVKKDDTIVLSSKFIPGNEKAIAAIINRLYRLGADVIYEKISGIHVSGHAFKEELRQMLDLIRPEYFIPIHGEYRHLVLHARLAEEFGILKEKILLAENGRVIEFSEAGGRIGGQVVSGRILIDGKGIGDVGRNVLKERRILSEDGIVAVIIAFDEETGIIVYGPEIVSRGFVFGAETGHLIEDAQCVILELVEEMSPDIPDRLEKIRLKIQRELRKYFTFTIRRRPVILPFIMEV